MRKQTPNVNNAIYEITNSLKESRLDDGILRTIENFTSNGDKEQYLCDEFSAMADESIPMWNDTLLDWSKDNYGYIEDAVNEYGIEGILGRDKNFDFMKLLRAGYYEYASEVLSDNQKDIVALFVLEHLKDKQLELDISQIETLREADLLNGNLDFWNNKLENLFAYAENLSQKSLSNKLQDSLLSKEPIEIITYPREEEDEYGAFTLNPLVDSKSGEVNGFELIELVYKKDEVSKHYECVDRQDIEDFNHLDINNIVEQISLYEKINTAIDEELKKNPITEEELERKKIRKKDD